MADSDTLTKTRTGEALDVPWNVIVHDDPVNLMGYVTYVLMKIFGYDEKTTNEQVVAAFCKRLKNVAGFEHVSEAMPMRNTTNAIVYYLIFASQNPVAASIVRAIFKKHWDRCR